MNKFESSFEFKIIYIFRVDGEKHKGLLKIGDTTLKTDKLIDKLSPNSKELNQAAMKRIKEYTNTVAVKIELLHTELAIKQVRDKTGSISVKAFRDHDVHRVLENSGIKNELLEGSILTAEDLLNKVLSRYDYLDEILK